MKGLTYRARTFPKFNGATHKKRPGFCFVGQCLGGTSPREQLLHLKGHLGYIHFRRRLGKRWANACGLACAHAWAPAMAAGAPAIRPNRWRLLWRLLESTCHATCHASASTRHASASTRYGAHAMQPNHAWKNGVTYNNKWGANPT